MNFERLALSINAVFLAVLAYAFFLMPENLFQGATVLPAMSRLLGVIVSVLAISSLLALFQSMDAKQFLFQFFFGIHVAVFGANLLSFFTSSVSIWAILSHLVGAVVFIILINRGPER